MTTTVWELPCLSQECERGPRLRQDLGDRVAIGYDFETESGDYAWEELTFTGVAGFRFTSAPHCSPEQVDAYDRLQEVAGSPWAAGLRDTAPGARHYRIYFDDAGCYEVLADGFSPPAPR